jgi:hypothetical protein
VAAGARRRRRRRSRRWSGGQARALAGPRQYVIACDPADDVENQAPQEIEDHAFNAAVVVDHRTGEQVAEFEGRIDHDIVARHLFLAGLFFGEGWLSVEATGGYGNAMLKTLWQRFSYKRLFERQRTDSRKEEKMRDRLGWDTNRRRSRRWSTARRRCCARDARDPLAAAGDAAHDVREGRPRSARPVARLVLRSAAWRGCRRRRSGGSSRSCRRRARARARTAWCGRGHPRLR